MASQHPLAKTIAAFGAGAVALLVFVLGAVWYSRPPMPMLTPVPDAPMDIAAFDAEPITPLPQAIELDADKVALGARLFHDPRLSHDDTLACASCHKLDAAGIDGRKTALGIGGQVGKINTPTVFNSGFNFVQFWDGRADSLEAQAAGPVHNPAEMGSNWPEVLGKLKQDGYYRSAFGRLYPSGLTAEAIQDAITTFERSLVTPDSRFDRWLRGDKDALSERELRGYRLFKELGCASCHQGVNIGGNFYAGLGVFGNFFADRGKDAPEDQGRFSITNKESDRHVFKVPSLRNIARTAPYFHDGSVAELPEAVRLMAKYQLGLELSREELDLITEFLETLTGKYQGESL